MKRVTGIGGVFFKAADPEALGAWYREHLGLDLDDSAHTIFTWREAENPSDQGATVWSLFPADTDYFSPSRSTFMINYRVDDLDAVLAALRDEGVSVDDHTEEYEYGRFGWLMDPEGNRIELWEPPRSGEARATDPDSPTPIAGPA
ncbi:MAG: VOC family protein [Chloroflexi bacterium]|nr:VOC family protein [Chloroflexota bacterium]